jgi:hypothetical protein
MFIPRGAECVNGTVTGRSTGIVRTVCLGSRAGEPVQEPRIADFVRRRTHDGIKKRTCYHG